MARSSGGELAEQRADLRQEAVAVVQPADQHVGQHIEALHQVELLEDHRAFGAPVAQAAALETRDIAALEEDAALAGLGQPVDQAQHGGLAGAGPADDADHLSCRHLEADAVHGLHRAEAPRQSFDFEHRQPRRMGRRLRRLVFHPDDSCAEA
jgi:hypothetical protein